MIADQPCNLIATELLTPLVDPSLAEESTTLPRCFDEAVFALHGGKDWKARIPERPLEPALVAIQPK